MVCFPGSSSGSGIKVEISQNDQIHNFYLDSSVKNEFFCRSKRAWETYHVLYSLKNYLIILGGVFIFGMDFGST